MAFHEHSLLIRSGSITLCSRCVTSARSWTSLEKQHPWEVALAKGRYSQLQGVGRNPQWRSWGAQAESPAGVAGYSKRESHSSTESPGWMNGCLVSHCLGRRYMNRMATRASYGPVSMTSLSLGLLWKIASWVYELWAAQSDSELFMIRCLGEDESAT